MIVGIGTDILLIDRISQVSYNLCDAFMQNTYTDDERKEAMAMDDPTLYFATRYAGKEAVVKALGCDEIKESFNQVEILSSSSSTTAACVTLYGEARSIAKSRNISGIMFSLSYDTDYAVSFAIAQSGEM